MQIIVNGEPQETSSECTVFQLLENHAVTHKAAVVELNGNILKQEHWQSTLLQLGDRLEILVFMGGG
ncbi:MAG: sulfur carrier protein ThiS [Desulfosporosinus sp.]|nr:sulfur carrier protein ThiS [Desulfosporosinus sp.]